MEHMGQNTQLMANLSLELGFLIEDENICNEELRCFLLNEKNFVVFSEELSKVIIKNGCIYSDKIEQTRYLLNIFKTKNIFIEPNTIKNWLTGKSNPQGSSLSRDNIYKLCFALNFDIIQTTDFFTKVYLNRPFDCRQIKELIYFFCIKNNLNFQTAERIFSQTLEFSTNTKNNLIERTEQISFDITKINTEDELLQYIEFNINSFKIKNKTSIIEINNLISQCKEIIQKHNQGHYISNDDILTEIYGGSMDKTRYDKINKKTINKNSQFIKTVKMNFPEKQSFNQLKVVEKVSYYTIRKILVLLKFFVFFKYDAMYIEPCDILDAYIDMSNDLLISCGYGKLYYRNPFDWMFLHCAASVDPLEEFKDIMAMMFFDSE